MSASLLDIESTTQPATSWRNPTAQESPWTVLVDHDGIIQSFDNVWPGLLESSGGSLVIGGSYQRFLAGLCIENPERAATFNVGIRSVASGCGDAFTLEFPCRIAGRTAHLRLTTTYYREGRTEGVLIVHTSADAPETGATAHVDSHAHQMEVLGRLTSGVAHDFANLLTLISGYSDMLLGRMHQQDPMRPEIEEIRKAASRGAGMTAQILDFIRSQVSQPKVINLNSLIGEVETLLRPIIGEHVSFAMNLSTDLGHVKADPAQLTRVIVNLVLNARDAMPQGGLISIHTANLELLPGESHHLPPGHYVTLTLTDNGHGMGAETMSHLFEPFFTTKSQNGTGLGLNTVYRIVEQAQGDIWVRSEPGKGTSFTICLPREGGESLDPESQLPMETAKTGTGTILFAEDEESVRKLIKHVLAHHGYDVLDAASGAEAVQIFEQHSTSIDLLLTDMVMPGMSGRELAQKLLAERPGLKVIYLSGYTDDLLWSTGALGPGMSFLRKPLRPSVLIDRVREVLD